MKKILLGLSLLASTSSFASNTSISCKSDFSILEMGNIKLEIVSEEGELKSFINGALSNPQVKVSDFSINSNIKYPLDAYSLDYSNYNFGERSLNAIYEQDNGIESPEEGEADFKLPSDITFDLAKVTAVKVYDLSMDNNSMVDKFGGQILIEAFDSNGELLGRAFRMILTKGCE